MSLSRTAVMGGEYFERLFDTVVGLLFLGKTDLKLDIDVSST